MFERPNKSLEEVDEGGRREKNKVLNKREGGKREGNQ